MDSLQASRQFIVFSISRLDLQHTLGFTHEQVQSLSDQDMERIAERVRENYRSMEDDFRETVRFVTAILLSEKTSGGTDE